MRGEGSLDSRFVHLDTSYQHQDTEDTGKLDPRYRQTRYKIPMVGVERCWPGYGCVIVGLVSIGKWISSARLGAAAGAGEHSGSAIYIQTMYTSHHTPDCSNTAPWMYKLDAKVGLKTIALTLFMNLFFYFLPAAVLCHDFSLVDSVET